MSSHTAQTELKLIGKLILEGDLHCETGLHIGAGKGSLEIGGADNPVVKDAFGRPYVPGSSLRGKMRVAAGAVLAAWPSPPNWSTFRGARARKCASTRATGPDDEICLLFGRNPGRMERVRGELLETNSATPARLTVYDAPLDPESITPQMRENLDDELTEVKSENAIDRITSQANPRTLERVPAGARFHVRMVLDVLCEEDKALPARLIEGLRLLEDDALGGGGSRGSGRVRFANLRLTWRGRGFYASGAPETEHLAGAGSGGAAVADELTRRFRRSSPSNHAAWLRWFAFVRPAPGASARIPARATASRRVYHSDTLYSAVTAAMARLGLLEEWLAAAVAGHGRPGRALQFLLPVPGRRRSSCCRRAPLAARAVASKSAGRARASCPCPWSRPCSPARR